MLYLQAALQAVLLAAAHGAGIILFVYLVASVRAGCNGPNVIAQVGQFGGLADDVESLKRDKNVLMVELVRVRQQQQVRPPPAAQF